MRIRPYIPAKDYEAIEKWIDNERTHVLWCANLLPYPITQKSFHAFLEKEAIDWNDSAYIATEDNGTPVGFFCYSLNTEDSVGFLKFILVDPASRGAGYGKKMLRLALQYAFWITGAEAVQLNVFRENLPARRCYEKAGFAERKVEQDIFSYQDETWSRCNMIVRKETTPTGDVRFEPA
ncbi:MAG: GNAT family N-acetyltransferase [Roseburia sp.]|nr:GNAT family N-acetyltransferase [Roseburia sp.]MCM1097861.1 GNAT family N-acetyltransferase [Ruminococcus flavefaciens]